MNLVNLQTESNLVLFCRYIIAKLSYHFSFMFCSLLLVLRVYRD